MISLYLYGTHSNARFLAHIKGHAFPILFDIEEGDEYPTKEYVSNETKLECTGVEERRTYYWLPLDCYNQPLGYVEEISLFPCDFKALKECKNHRYTYPYWWIFESENDAIERALD